MEKLTPTRFSAVKAISGSKNGKAYAFNSIGFLTREHGDKKWFNFAFNGDNPLKEGQVYELDIKERPYTDKEGNPKIAYDAKKPDPFGQLSKQVFDLNVRMGKLESRIDLLEKSDATPPKILDKPTPAEMDEPPDDLPF